MTQIIGGFASNLIREDQIQRAIKSALKPNTPKDRAKYHLDRLMHLASRYPVFTCFGRTKIANPEGRIAAIIKRASPYLLRQGRYNMILNLDYYWTRLVDNATKYGRPVKLYIHINQIRRLREAGPDASCTPHKDV